MTEGVTSRRGFIAATAAGLAGGMAVASRASARQAAGQPGTPAAAPAVGAASPNGQIAVGLIGCGKRMRELVDSRQIADPRFRVVAVCDVHQGRREDHKARIDALYGNTDCVATGIDEEVFARDDIDAVFIMTPDHWHVPQCLRACATKKHIYCDKPLLRTLHEGRVLVEAVKKSGVTVLTGSQQRTEFGQLFVQAVELVHAGAVGRVLSVSVGVGDPPKACDLPQEDMEPGLDWNRWLGPAPARAYSSVLCPRGVHDHFPAWRDYIEYGGGRINDWGAHHFDIAQWMLKMDRSGPTEVLPPPADDLTVRGASFRYPGGVTLTHGGPWGVTVIGTEGSIFVTREYISSNHPDVLKREVSEEHKIARHGGHVKHFADCVLGEAKPICDAEVGARSSAVALLAGFAYRTRRALKWDAQAWRFVDDDAANAELDGPFARRPGFELPTV